MTRRGYRPEQIINKLREAEVLLSQVTTTYQVTTESEASEQIYYLWGR